MTPEQLLQQIAEQQAVNTQAIADLNQAVNFLVTEALRPAVQQSSANYERIERLEAVVEAGQQQLASNTQAITALIQLAEGNQQRLDVFDSRLEETRALVADNGSQIAQIGVKVDANAVQISQLQESIRESRQETEALKELSRSQLAGIIGNGRRIDRLEQQAS